MSRMHKRQGFTLIELTIVVAAVAFVGALLVPLTARFRETTNSAECVSNLKEVAAAFPIYADANHGQLPSDALPASWDQQVKAFVPSGDSFRCPGDKAGQTVGLSYAWRGDTTTPFASASLSGRRLAAVRRDSLVLVFDSLSDWHGDGRINAAALDTSCRGYALAEFDGNLETPVQ